MNDHTKAVHFFAFVLNLSMYLCTSAFYLLSIICARSFFLSALRVPPNYFQMLTLTIKNNAFGVCKIKMMHKFICIQSGKPRSDHSR